jgi:isoquinoline 1-oxidoreductase beta subunit
MTHIDQFATLNTPVSRRRAMIGAAGLTFAFALSRSPAAEAAALAASPGGKTINPWVSIAADGTISIATPATEMGQGSWTSLPRVLAEELDADWDKVRIVRAPVIEKIYGNPGFGGMMYTAGSNAVRNYFQPMRTFGAQVRRVLIDNAAKHWGVPAAELSTEPSTVVHAKTGRRLGYGEIAAFAELPATAPDIKPGDLKKHGDFRLIGHDTTRVELPSKVNGSAKYAIDVQVPGMLYGAVVRAPVEGATADKIDDARAKAVSGVLQVVTLPYGVGVVAETPWAAFEARDHIAADTTWTRSGAGWGFDSERGAEAFAAAAADPAAKTTVWSKAGDVAAAAPAAVIEGGYRCDYAYHAQMEPLNAVAAVSTSGDAAEIWVGTQSQTMAVEAAARALGISRDKIKLNDMLMGGGFGRRGPRDMDFLVDAVLLSKVAGKPVKVMWTREDDVHNGRFRPLTAHHLHAGFDAAGKLVSWTHRVAGDRVTPFADPIRYRAAKGKDFILMLGTDIAGYDVPNQLVEQVYEDTGMRTMPLRGIGVTANKYATEAFVDEIAVKRGLDPVVFRLQLLKNEPRGRAVVERAAQMAQWGRKRDGRGLGFAYINYSNSLLAGVAEISLDRATGEITLHDFWCTIDCGIPVHPDNVVAQTQSSIVYGLGLALSERITMKNGVVEQSNFNDYLVTRMTHAPAIHIEVIATDNAPTGVGQMATPLVAPAIKSAVAQLTGVHLRETPMTPDRVKAALG